MDRSQHRYWFKQRSNRSWNYQISWIVVHYKNTTFSQYHYCTCTGVVCDRPRCLPASQAITPMWFITTMSGHGTLYYHVLSLKLPSIIPLGVGSLVDRRAYHIEAGDKAMWLQGRPGWLVSTTVPLPHSRQKGVPASFISYRGRHIIITAIIFIFSEFYFHYMYKSSLCNSSLFTSKCIQIAWSHAPLFFFPFVYL